MRMMLFLVSRVAGAAVLVLAVVVLNFILIRLAPGDIVDTIAGTAGGMSDQVRAQITQAYGLDRSFGVQMGSYIGRMLTGDFGYSLYFNQPVSELVVQRLPATALLVFTALGLSVLIGVPMGVMSSHRPNGVLSQTVTVLSLAAYAAPIFWTGIVLIIIFASAFPVFPVAGMRQPGIADGAVAQTLDVLWHLTLPAVTLAIVYLAQYSRLTRAGMIDALSADYVRTARAKGVGETQILFKHALRNALLPVITMIGFQFGNVIAGAVLVETVFNWPGLGRLAFDSILRRDYPTVLAILAASAVMTILANLVTDLVYQQADPRLREG